MEFLVDGGGQGQWITKIQVPGTNPVSGLHKLRDSCSASLRLLKSLRLYQRPVLVSWPEGIAGQVAKPAVPGMVLPLLDL